MYWYTHVMSLKRICKKKVAQNGASFTIALEQSEYIMANSKYMYIYLYICVQKTNTHSSYLPFAFL